MNVYDQKLEHLHDHYINIQTHDDDDDDDHDHDDDDDHLLLQQRQQQLPPSAPLPPKLPSEPSLSIEQLTSSLTPDPNDSIHLHRQRLNRFHQSAKSILSASSFHGNNSNSSNVNNNNNNNNNSNNNNNNNNSSSSSIPNRGLSPTYSVPTSKFIEDNHTVQLDTIRLAKFHQQAVSFLDRAYANDSSTLITEEQLSPTKLSRIQDKQLLESFHQETMNILDASSAVAVTTTIDDHSNNLKNKHFLIPSTANITNSNDSSNMRPTSFNQNTMSRIERDKAKLEQHYQDAMSFLNRTEKDNNGELIEEQELETATVDRLQLQKYAREAMSFLDKAFSGDSSVLVDDGDDHDHEHQIQSQSQNQNCSSSSSALKNVQIISSSSNASSSNISKHPYEQHQPAHSNDNDSLKHKHHLLDDVQQISSRSFSDMKQHDQHGCAMNNTLCTGNNSMNEVEEDEIEDETEEDKVDTRMEHATLDKEIANDSDEHESTTIEHYKDDDVDVDDEFGEHVQFIDDVDTHASSAIVESASEHEHEHEHELEPERSTDKDREQSMKKNESSKRNFPTVASSIRRKRSEEDRQIAEDRAALERYDEEFGDFLDMAYDNISTVIVEDADSETSGTGGDKLYARRMAPSTPSADDSSSVLAEEENILMDHRDDHAEIFSDEEKEEEVENVAVEQLKQKHAQNEQQVRKHVQEMKPICNNEKVNKCSSSSSNSSSSSRNRTNKNRNKHKRAIDPNASLHKRMKQYELDAANYLEEANVSEEEDAGDYYFNGANNNGQHHDIAKSEMFKNVHQLNSDYDNHEGTDGDIDTQSPSINMNKFSKSDSFKPKNQQPYKRRISHRNERQHQLSIAQEKNIDDVADEDHFDKHDIAGPSNMNSVGSNFKHFKMDHHHHEIEDVSDNHEKMLIQNDHHDSCDDFQPGSKNLAGLLHEEMKNSEVNEMKPLRDEKPTIDDDELSSNINNHDNNDYISNSITDCQENQKILEKIDLHSNGINIDNSLIQKEQKEQGMSKNLTSSDRKRLTFSNDLHESVANVSMASSGKISKSNSSTNSGSNLRMDLKLEDGTGQTGGWKDVQLATSFYRQIPRGSTIKLRPRPSMKFEAAAAPVEHESNFPVKHSQLMERDERSMDNHNINMKYNHNYDNIANSTSSESTAPTINSSKLIEEEEKNDLIPLSALQRVEKERDVLIATLEEIINERSMLAAQMKEMKSFLPERRKQDDEIDDEGQSKVNSTTTSNTEDTEIDLAAELREAHTIMAILTQEMDQTLTQVEQRNKETLERAQKVEEKCIRLESDSYRMEGELTAKEKRITQAVKEEKKLRGEVEKLESKLEHIQKQNEKDLEYKDRQFRDERDKEFSRIQDLNEEIGRLKQKLEQSEKQIAKNAASSHVVSKGFTSSVKKSLESEIASLKLQLSESERLRNEEIESSRKKREELENKWREREQESVRSIESKKKESEDKLESELEAIKKDHRKSKNDNMRLMDEVSVMERRRAMAELDAEEARKRQRITEVEVQELRSRFEASMREKMSKLNSANGLTDLEESLKALKDNASKREEAFEKQLRDFRERAQAAELAASSAEKDAKEAAEMVKLAQERGKAALDVERVKREKAEKERDREREKAKEQLNSPASSGGGGGVVGLVKSSSRRALRKSASKKDRDSKAGTSADAGASNSGYPQAHQPRKRSNYRAMFFGQN